MAVLDAGLYHFDRQWVYTAVAMPGGYDLRRRNRRLDIIDDIALDAKYCQR